MQMLRILLDPIRIRQFEYATTLSRSLSERCLWKSFVNCTLIEKERTISADIEIYGLLLKGYYRFFTRNCAFWSSEAQDPGKFKFFLERAVCERHVIITPLHLHALFAWKAEDVNVIWRAPTFPLLRLAFLYTSFPLDSAIFSSFDFASHPLRCRAM